VGKGAVCIGGSCGCPSGQSECGTAYAPVCADLATDSLNCGACGVVCGPGTHCEKGKCACDAAGGLCAGNCNGACAITELCSASSCVGSCPTGATACAGGCTDTKSDPVNCGGCGKRCLGGRACGAGQCACPPGTTECGGQCVDLKADPANCGSCKKACGLGSCVGGSCQCTSGTLSCGGLCVAQNDENCGGCGIKCGPGTSCQGDPYPWSTARKCKTTFGGCQPGFSQCYSGGPNPMPTCVDLKNDLANCGACNNDCTKMACFGSYNCYCTDGVCQSGCAAPKIQCMDSGAGKNVCVDLQESPNHCGTCGTKCGPGLGCWKGQCQACPTGTQNCSGSCVDLQTNVKHCGGCGQACEKPDPYMPFPQPRGLICEAGQCGCPSGKLLSCGSLSGNQARCVDFLSSPSDCGLCSASCSSGTSCTGGSCSCVAPKKMCSGKCYDLATDPYQCGSCGKVCPSPEVCSQGSCAASCATGLTSCSRACVDLTSSNAHCGKCYAACPAGKSCVASVCS
jgi:hypothetical protein